jgi:hypothetical protein
VQFWAFTEAEGHRAFFANRFDTNAPVSP